MLLFPIMLLWIVGVLIWIVRNNITDEPGERAPRDWTRWRPRPHRPRDGRAGASARRLGVSRRAARERRTLRP